MKSGSTGISTSGQVLTTATGWLVFDFEGEPARELAPAARSTLRSRTWPGCSAELRVRRRGRRAAARRAAARARREAFLEGYGGPGHRACCPDKTPIAGLLGALELEKLLYELRYELHPPGLGADPGRSAAARGGNVSEQASSEGAEIRRLVELRHPDPHQRPRHPPRRRRRWWSAPSGPTRWRSRAPGLRRERFPMRPPGATGSSRRGSTAATKSSATCCEVDYPRRRRFTLRDPYSFLPTLGEIDLVPRRRGPPRAALGAAGRAPLPPPRLSGVVVRGLGAHRARASPWWATSTAGTAGCTRCGAGRLRHLGAVHPRGAARARATSSRSARAAAARRCSRRTRSPSAPRCRRATASVVHDLDHYPGTTRRGWQRRAEATCMRRADGASTRCTWARWRRVVEDGNRPLTYRELADALADYVSEMGFTHVELHAGGGAPLRRQLGLPGQRLLRAHRALRPPGRLPLPRGPPAPAGIGVSSTGCPRTSPATRTRWPASTARALYEHEDPRQGAHPDWGTLVFNFGRNEVRNFLIANALFWLEQYHVDGLRVDAVASMLYLDYSRKRGRVDAQPLRRARERGGHRLPARAERRGPREHPGVVMIAEESTAWPKVTAPAARGRAGLPLQVEHGLDARHAATTSPRSRSTASTTTTSSPSGCCTPSASTSCSRSPTTRWCTGRARCSGKMPGDAGRSSPTCARCSAGCGRTPGRSCSSWAASSASPHEWNHDQSLDWHLLEEPERRRDPEARRAAQRACTGASRRSTSWTASRWGSSGSRRTRRSSNVYAFLRRAKAESALDVRGQSGRRAEARLPGGPPGAGHLPGGAQHGRLRVRRLWRRQPAPIQAEEKAWDGQPASAELTLPPLSVIRLVPDAPEHRRKPPTGLAYWPEVPRLRMYASGRPALRAPRTSAS